MKRNDGFTMVKELALVFFLITIPYVSRAKDVASDPVFTEGGGPVPYALEEEILEELAKGQHGKIEESEFAIPNAGKEQPKSDNVVPAEASVVAPASTKDQEKPQKPSSSSDSQNRPVGVNSQQVFDQVKSQAAEAIMKQTTLLQQQQQQQQQKPPKQKKEGQEEFATFVDPFQNPAQNRRLAAEKPSFGDHFGHESKRAPLHSGKPGEGDDLGDTVFIAVTTVCSAAAVFGLIGAGVCWYRLHKQYKAAQDVEYPHYGVTGPAKERTSGNASPVAAMDAKLASSAQLYHYQHTKQQIIAMEHSTSDAKGQESEDSEGEGDEGDFSVYECPGLAPTGDIEVSNPLFENVASPHAKVDPRHQQQTEEELSPRVHQRSPARDEDP